MCQVLSIEYSSLPSDIKFLQTVSEAREAHSKQDRRSILSCSEGSGGDEGVKNGLRIHWQNS